MSTKGRNWAFVMYPDSMPSDWYDRLQATGLPFAISPLHAEDLDPTGEQKKPHYHVLTYYESPTTSKSVKEHVCDIVNATIPIKLESLQGMYRYHIHKDNPEKHQYLDKDRIFINGFDTKRVEDLSYYEIKALCRSLYDFICNNDIYEYSDLIDILNNSQSYNELDVVEDHVSLFKTYINSRRYKKEQEDKRKLLTTSHN